MPFWVTVKIIKWKKWCNRNGTRRKKLEICTPHVFWWKHLNHKAAWKEKLLIGETVLPKIIFYWIQPNGIYFDTQFCNGLIKSDFLRIYTPRVLSTFCFYLKQTPNVFLQTYDSSGIKISLLKLKIIYVDMERNIQQT